MNNKTTYVIVFGLVVFSVFVGAHFYPSLPAQIASHWNTQGEVDDYIPKFWGMFLIPMMMTGLALLFIIIPHIDPLKKNIESFRPYYNQFLVVISVFLFYIFLMTLVWNIGYLFDFSIFIVPALAAMWYFLGVILSKAKRNWFIGIRTPWTLSSDIVWEKTHRLGSILFKAMATLTLAGLLFPSHLVFLSVVPAVAVAILLIIHSYVEYQRVQKNNS